MAEKDWKSALGNLYDAMPKDPNEEHVFVPPVEEEPAWTPNKETVYIYKDRKMRKGKTVTAIEGIDAPDEILEQLAKELKTSCGAGGSIKDGLIIIQGDFKQKIKTFLDQKGFKTKLR